VNARRLYRCRQDRLLAGVAGGIAEYLEVDPTLVRVLWILSAFLGGFTILLYLILVFIMPLEPLQASAPGPMPGGAPAGGPVGGPADPATAGTGADTDAPTTGWGPASARATSDAAAATTGWTPGGWHAAGWSAHRHDTPGQDRGSGRAGLLVGVVLIVFGSIALLGALIPAWATVGLGPALVLALGVALVIASSRRGAPER
jgi:phage shock protein PspC (stress-responsive transcriptional regulator)